MSPVFLASDDPKNLMTNQYLFQKPGEVYMLYTGSEGQTLSVNLSGSGSYLLQVIDTWGMEIVEARTVTSGEFSFTPQAPHTALLLKRAD